MEYGAKEIKRVVDDNGSTVTVESNYSGWSPKTIFRVEYSIRNRVTNKIEEQNVINSFSDKYQDPKYKDPVVSIERSAAGNKHGYYYVVTSWKELRNTSTHQPLMELIDQL